MIIAVFGLPGSGKTFFAGQLALIVNGRLISSDVVRAGLKSRVKYDSKSRERVYRLMLAMMEAAVIANRNVVLDATFYKESMRRIFKEKAIQLHCPFYFIEIKASEETIKERVAKKRTASEADFAVYLKVSGEFEPLNEDHLILYSDQQELSKMLETAIKYINYL